MSMKLFLVNYEPYVAENEEMAREFFHQNYPLCYSPVVQRVENVQGYKIVPIGKNINNVLDQIALNYLMDYSG